MPDQDRSLWDYAQIQRGMTALEQAQRLGGGAKPYALQAAIAACHMRARTAEETDWDRIVLLYDALLQINPSPIVALNRAVAVGMAQGPAAGLDALDAAATLAGDSALGGYHLFPSVRGDLLMKMGRLSEAREEIQRAITMTQEPAGTGIAGEQAEADGEGGLLSIGAVLSFAKAVADAEKDSDDFWQLNRYQTKKLPFSENGSLLES